MTAPALVGETATLPEQLLVTAGAVLGGLVVAYLLVVGARRLRERRDTRLVDVAVAAVIVGVALAVGSIVVAVWDAEAFVAQLLAGLENPARTGSSLILTVITIAAVYVGTDVLYRAVQRLYESREGISMHQAEVSFRVLQVIVYIGALIVVLGFWDQDLSGVLVGAGFLGIVLGMAARQTLGSMIAGFVLMFSRPFEIGDWVQIGDKEGIVTDITIVNTRIQSFDGEYVMLPNDTVSSSDIVNRTRKGRLRIRVRVGVDYGTDLELAESVAVEAMREVDVILTVPQPQVVLTGFDDSAITLELRFWIDKPTARKRWRAVTAVVRGVKVAFDANGIKIPFPQRELSDRAGSGGFRVEGGPEGAVEAAPDGADG